MQFISNFLEKKSKGRKNDEDCILKGNWYNGGRGEDDEISGSYF